MVCLLSVLIAHLRLSGEIMAMFTNGSASIIHNIRERIGSVLECLTRDHEAAGSSLNDVTALWSLSKTHLS